MDPSTLAPSRVLDPSVTRLTFDTWRWYAWITP